MKNGIIINQDAHEGTLREADAINTKALRGWLLKRFLLTAKSICCVSNQSDESEHFSNLIGANELFNVFAKQTRFVKPM